MKCHADLYIVVAAALLLFPGERWRGARLT